MLTKSATEGLFKLAQRAPFNIAPEKGELLARDIFGPKKWTIQDGTGHANFEAIPSKAIIILPYSGLASLWCIAYAAFHITDIASRAQRQTDFNSAQHIDIGKEFKQLNIDGYVDFSKKLFLADSSWPSSLVQPNSSAALSTDEGKINNTFFGALSWIMLHEIAHVYHKDSALVPSSISIAQEYKADEFATNWILENAGSGLKREFRVLMISVALCWLFLCESVRGQGTTHPPTILRFREVVSKFNVRERSPGIENAFYLFKALLDPSGPAPKVDSPKEAFDEMCERLEDLYPVRA